MSHTLPLDFTDSFCKQRNYDIQEGWIPSWFKLWSVFSSVFSFQPDHFSTLGFLLGSVSPKHFLLLIHYSLLPCFALSQLFVLMQKFPLIQSQFHHLSYQSSPHFPPVSSSPAFPGPLLSASSSKTFSSSVSCSVLFHCAPLCQPRFLSPGCISAFAAWVLGSKFQMVVEGESETSWN